jgi:hypothetical protein
MVLVGVVAFLSVLWWVARPRSDNWRTLFNLDCCRSARTPPDVDLEEERERNRNVTCGRQFHGTNSHSAVAVLKALGFDTCYEGRSVVTTCKPIPLARKVTVLSACRVGACAYSAGFA